MAVGVAQNASSSTYQLTYMAAGNHVMGRSFAALDVDTLKNYSYSYTYGGKEYSVDQRNDFATQAGRNFQQQWDYAIKCDPDVILVTGWNEWVAQRQPADIIKNEPIWFVDCATYNCSRDVEPAGEVFGDNYYIYK